MELQAAGQQLKADNSVGTNEPKERKRKSKRTQTSHNAEQ